MDLTVVDSFTDRPFAGNPAAVAVLDAFPDDARMQAVAGEMNLSETAYAVARPDGSYDLRWFSPTVEVDLCGHATLATAHVLGGSGRFHTRSGELVCAPAPDGRIDMDFPADPYTLDDAPPAIDAALGSDGAAAVRAVARARAAILWSWPTPPSSGGSAPTRLPWPPSDRSWSSSPPLPTGPASTA